jgi:DNA-binding HxlR family transcriptional regulator
MALTPTWRPRRSYAEVMGASYYQFCPVAKAMELLDERWTLLVIREMLAGSQHFNELRRGLPRMSPGLLSKRLHQLVGAGLVTKEVDGSQIRYQLTQAGQELAPVVNGIAAWGVRWIGELGDHELDPKLLMWDLHRHVDHEEVPDRRTVLWFEFTDVVPKVRHWWLVITPSAVDVCDADPGFETSAYVRADLRMLIKVWRGDLTWESAVRSGQLQVEAPAGVRRSMPRWFQFPGQVWSEIAGRNRGPVPVRSG